MTFTMREVPEEQMDEAFRVLKDYVEGPFRGRPRHQSVVVSVRQEQEEPTDPSHHAYELYTTNKGRHVCRFLESYVMEGENLGL